LGRHLVLKDIAKLPVGAILEQTQQDEYKRKPNAGQVPANVVRDAESPHGRYGTAASIKSSNLASLGASPNR
jgi:hypothetical protein